MRRALLPLALTVGAACDEPADKPPQLAVTRVEAVAASGKQATESDLCDVLKPKESAPTFALPELDGAAPPAARSARWVNVWATWCPPCVEELPLITRFRGELDKAGLRVELLLLSVDQTAEIVTKFQVQHPEVAGTLRASDPSKLEEWLKSIGLDAGAPLPLHVFVDVDGKVRCARAGALRETDLPLVKKVLSGM